MKNESKLNMEFKVFKIWEFLALTYQELRALKIKKAVKFGNDVFVFQKISK